jgi:hypothetical protein
MSRHYLSHAPLIGPGADGMRYRGTVEEKFRYLMQTVSDINRQHNRGIRESTKLDRLLGEKRELERDIYLHLHRGERLQDEIMDYCLSHFYEKETVPTGLFSIEGKEITRSGLVEVPLMKQFTGYVKKIKGQKAFSYSGYDDMETGVISGQSEFSMDNGKYHYRSLSIPVEKLLVFNREKGRWEKQRPRKKDGQSLLFIDPNIFQYPENRNRENFSFYASQYRPAEHITQTEVYLGDDMVEHGLRIHKTIELDAKDRRLFSANTMKVPNPWK